MFKVIDYNGEHVTNINDGDRIIRRESVNYLNNTISWGKDMPFVKMFTNFLPDIALNLSGGAAIVAIALSPYVAYNSNLLCNRSNNNPLNNDDIASITGYTKRQTIRILDELISSKILARVKVGRNYQYYANPYIFSRGSRINKTLEAMFKNYPHKSNNGVKK